MHAPACAPNEVLLTHMDRTAFPEVSRQPFVPTPSLMSRSPNASTPWLSALCTLVLLLFGQTADAQRLSYSSGQNVSPAYEGWEEDVDGSRYCLLYTSPSPRDLSTSRMPSSA